MKKKHQPIPDFSGKRKDAGMRAQPSQQKSQTQPNTPPRVTKPAATSSKSGRRGG
ncbi:MAG: hypothetical protein M3Z17_11855 [Gemmatimonadota bacterium]|nr:hypothetical protein [Gemmatimonadota bacterium]